MNNIKKIIKNGIMITSFTLLSGGLIHQFEKNDIILEEKVLQEVKAKSNIDEELQQKYIKILEEKEELQEPFLYEEVVEDEVEEELEEVVEETEEVEEVEEVEDQFDEVYHNSIIEELTRVKKQVQGLEDYIEDLEELRIQEEAKIK